MSAIRQEEHVSAPPPSPVKHYESAEIRIYLPRRLGASRRVLVAYRRVAAGCGGFKPSAEVAGLPEPKAPRRVPSALCLSALLLLAVPHALLVFLAGTNVTFTLETYLTPRWSALQEPACAALVTFTVKIHRTRRR